MYPKIKMIASIFWFLAPHHIFWDLLKKLTGQVTALNLTKPSPCVTKQIQNRKII